MGNHKSFRGECELLLIPAYDRTRPVVPVTAVFGANGSGKSNLLDALSWFRLAVLQSYRTWEIDWGIPRTRYRLDPESSAEPSSYAVDIVIDGVQYLYAVSLDSEAVREEWLYSYPHKQKRIVFERHGQEIVLGSTVGDRRSRTEVLAGLMRPNTLLLSVAAQADQAEVLPVYRWFRDGIILGNNPPRTSQAIANQVEAAIARFPEFVELVRVADLGIADMIVTDAGGKRVVFLHGESRSPLDWEDQSEGTRVWVQMLISVLTALATGAVLTVDEIDASLHPRLTARLIELFRNAATNEHGAQLFFTTHDATLLGTSLGEEILRRDEIWFVEKIDGVSSLFPLSDFRPRNEENRERRYLGGSYGAVPAVFTDSLVDGVLKAHGDRDAA